MVVMVRKPLVMAKRSLMMVSRGTVTMAARPVMM